jgi:predicted MFS family arabinose efflux permease
VIRLPSVKRFGLDVWLLGLAAALLTGGNLGMMQLLKVMYVLRLGFGPESVGVLFAAGSLSFSASSLPGAALGGRWGPKRILLLGGVINVLGMSLVLLTELVPIGWRPMWPALVQVVSSCGWSFLMVNMVTMIVAVTTSENRKSAYALREASGGLGMFFGTFFGGMLPAAFAGRLGLTLDHPAPYRYGLLVSVILALLGIIPLLFVRPAPPAPRIKRQGRPNLSPLLALAPILVAGYLNNGAVASCKAFAYAYMDQEFAIPTSVVGVISSVGMGLGVFGALSSSRLARARSSGHVMVLASAALAGGLLIMGTIAHPVAAALGTIAQFILSALFVPAYQVLQMEKADPEWRWLVAGACNMGMSLGFGTISLSGGYIVAAVGYRRVFLLGALFALASAAVMWSLLRRRKEQAAQQALREATP